MHVEFAPFSIFGRQYNFIRLGSWNSNNPIVAPKEIWCANGDFFVLFYEHSSVPIRETEDNKKITEDSSDSGSEEKPKK